jgi:hypothetical protein
MQSEYKWWVHYMLNYGNKDFNDLYEKAKIKETNNELCPIHSEKLNDDGICNTCLEKSNK